LRRTLSVYVTMTQLTMHRSFDAPRTVVWDVITDPDVYEAVAPNLAAVEIIEGDGEGMVRKCTDTNGNSWTETCHTWKPEQGFAVTVDTETSEFHKRLFTRFEGEWRLSTGDNGVVATIQFDYDTKYGPFGWLLDRYFQYKGPSLIEAIFDGWQAEIDARLAASSHSTKDPDPNVPESRPNDSIADPRTHR
jgi:uncharacterized protein YndB with AHSA1/START domain